MRMRNTHLSIEMTNLTQHPLSAAWPAMQADEYQSLKSSIEVIGIQNPITLFEGMVIDGWHRYSACADLGIHCPSKLLGDVDPVDFVKSQNDARRHITASQKALAITSIYAWKPAHREKKSVPGTNLSKSTAELAAIAGVSESYIEKAKAVQANATPEVKAAVKAGTMSVKKAAATTKPAKQKPAVAPESDPEPINEDKEAIAILSEENDRLNDRLAVAAMDATEEERAAAESTIDELRKENKTLRALNKQLTISRDGFQNQVAEMQKQINRQRREIDKLAGTKTA